MSVNTILITGTAKPVQSNVLYDVVIWGSKKGDPIQFIRSYKKELSDYSELWREAKDIAHQYFNEGHMQDGAYTQFLDHLIMIN